jgi:hypothetical protein
MNIAEDYAHYQNLLERHGIRITRRVLLQELYQLQQGDSSAETLKRILERPSRRTPRLKRRRAATRRLRRALSDLDKTLEQFETSHSVAA